MWQTAVSIASISPGSSNQRQAAKQFQSFHGAVVKAVGSSHWDEDVDDGYLHQALSFGSFVTRVPPTLDLLLRLCSPKLERKVCTYSQWASILDGL